MKKNICTVLLITYNHKQYIKKSIESVLCQKTKYPFVIKIFDDASTDGSSDIVREYANKYPDKIEAHVAKTNQGAQTNIWNAYKSVDTKYCCLLETDDYWCDKYKLEQQITALESHPECSFCAHQTIVHNINDKYRADEDGIKIITNTNVLKSEIVSLSHIQNYPVGSGYIPFVGSRMIRMSCIDLNKIKHKEAFLFDNSQFYYMLLRGDMYFINKIMSVYNQSGCGVCSGATPYNRAIDYVNALMELNKETNGTIQERVLLEINFYISYNLYLLRKQTEHKNIFLYGYFCGLPLLKVMDNNNNIKIKRLFGLIKFSHNPDKTKLSLAGIPIFQIERRFDGIRHNGLIRRTICKFRLCYKNIKMNWLLKKENQKATDFSLMILDNYEPSPLLSGFRVKEFTWILNNISGSGLVTLSKDILKYSDWEYRNSVGDINWNFPMDINTYDKYRTRYIQQCGVSKDALVYMNSDKQYSAKGAFIMFIYNAYVTYKFLESQKIPFVFVLFPGGGLRLNHSFSDHMLRAVCASPMFRGVFVTQKIIYDYLIDKKLCQKNKIFFDYGGGFVQFTNEDILPKKWYNVDKNTFDISFVAHKYMNKGLDKGFDLFLYVAREIIKKYPFVHFHCIGTNTLSDFTDDFADLKNNLHMYGTQQKDFFPPFYQKMDINLSPNRPFVLDKGAFDGFPLSIEAMLFGVPLFCTDELKQNHNYVENKELVIIKPEVKDIVNKIEYYIKHLQKLHAIGRSGQRKINKLFNLEYQQKKRKEFLCKYLNIK